MKRCFNKSEAGELLGLSLSTIDRLIESGELTCKKLKRRVLITMDDLAVFLGSVEKAESLFKEDTK